MKRLLQFSLVILIISCSNLSAQVTKITPTEPTVEDSFGWSLAIDGDFMAISNIYDDDLGIQSGSVLMYHWDGIQWVEQQKITASDGGYAEYFGYSVEIDNNRMVVGAYRGNDDLGIDVGSAYVYEYNGSIWEEKAILQPEGGVYDDRFGHDVDIYGDYVVVGAVGEDDLAIDCGAVFLYKYDGSEWNLEEKIVPVDLEAGDIFGVCVTLNNNYLVIGSFSNYSGTEDCGVVYTYYHNGTSWTFNEIIGPADPTEGMLFGSDVAIDNNNLVVGAYHDNVYALNSGSAYVYSNDGANWIQQSKLIPPRGTADDRFGGSVAINGNDIICGSLNYFDGSYDKGAAFYFMFDDINWTYQSIIKQPQEGNNGYFGKAVAITDGYGLIGAPYDDENGYRSGAAYLFDLTFLLGVNELNKPATEAFRIYPTITNSQINIVKLEDYNKDVTIEVINLSGLVVKTFNMPANQKRLSLQLEIISKGGYIIKINNSNEIVHIDRIIVK